MVVGIASVKVGEQPGRVKGLSAWTTHYKILLAGYCS